MSNLHIDLDDLMVTPGLGNEISEINLVEGAQLLWDWEDIRDGDFTISEGTLIVDSQNRIFTILQNIDTGNATVRALTPSNFDAAGLAYFQGTSLPDVHFVRTAGGDRRYVFGQGGGSAYRDSELVLVLATASDKITQAMKVDHAGGLVLINQNTGPTPPDVDPFDSSTYTQVRLLHMGATPRIGDGLVTSDSLEATLAARIPPEAGTTGWVWTKTASGAAWRALPGLQDNEVQSRHLANGAVLRDKIGNDAVNGSKVANDSIDLEHFAHGTAMTMLAFSDAGVPQGATPAQAGVVGTSMGATQPTSPGMGHLHVFRSLRSVRGAHTYKDGDITRWNGSSWDLVSKAADRT